MFDTQSAADQAKAKLVAAGFASSAVSMTGNTTSSASTTRPAGTIAADEPHHEGAIARFFDRLFGGDDNDVDRAGYTDTYKEAFRRGSYGVTVTASNDSEIDKAGRILNDCGAVDIDEKSEEWKKEGWKGAALAGGSTAAAKGNLKAGTTQKLKEIEEELKIGKRAIARGGVRIFTRMTEVPVEETVRLREERAQVQRTSVDRPATEADFAAFKEGSIEVREMSEEAVVSKTARVTGEVSVGKEMSKREEVVRDKVRKTKVEVEQIDGGKTAGTANTSNTGTTGSPNRDLLTGAPGSHPVGTVVGATAGGVAAGAAAGSVAGPVGTVVGAAVGAVAGGLAGKGAAEAVEPTFGKTRIKKPV